VIAASRCPACGRVAAPPRDRCQGCRARTDDETLDPEGTVLTYTSGAEGWIALVELAGGARTWVQAPSEPTIGERLSVDA